VIPAIVVAADDAYVQRAAFYDAVKQKNYTRAVSLGQAYLKANPSDDRFALDVAYAEINAGRTEDAIALLERLSSSSDPNVAALASRQLSSLTAPVPVYHPPPGYAYLYSQYESALADVFNGASIRYDLINPLHGVRPFAALHLSYDTRSGVPGFGQVYNDNAAVFDGGLRDPIGPYGYAFVEAGYSAGLRGQKSFPEVRYGFAYSRDYGSLQGPVHALLDGSIATYSRYQGNTLGYLAPSADVRVAGALRGIGGVTYAFDVRGLPGNNFVDVYGGPMLRLSNALALRTVAVRRMYLTPSPADYTGFRALLVYGTGFP
jgi:tetratricopeptide (TPR) repeat protein